MTGSSSLPLTGRPFLHSPSRSGFAIGTVPSADKVRQVIPKTASGSLWARPTTKINIRPADGSPTRGTSRSGWVQCRPTAGFTSPWCLTGRTSRSIWTGNSKTGWPLHDRDRSICEGPWVSAGGQRFTSFGANLFHRPLRPQLPSVRTLDPGQSDLAAAGSRQPGGQHPEGVVQPGEQCAGPRRPGGGTRIELGPHRAWPALQTTPTKVWNRYETQAR